MIFGLDAATTADEKVFMPGVAQQGNDIVTNGGRVLCVTALGDSVLAAQQKAAQLAVYPLE